MGSRAQKPENRRQNPRSVWVGEGMRRGTSDLRVPLHPPLWCPKQGWLIFCLWAGVLPADSF